MTAPGVHFASRVLANLSFVGTADREMRFVGAFIPHPLAVM